MGVLHTACRDGNVDVAIAIIAKGVDVDATDGMKYTALHYAARVGLEPVVHALLAANATVSLLNSKGQTALYQAVVGGHTHIVRQLIEKGADVNTATKSGLAPLHYAARSGLRDMVQVLLGAGASLSAKTREGHSAQYLARSSGQSEIIAMLSVSDAPMVRSSEDVAAKIAAVQAAAVRGEIDEDTALAMELEALEFKPSIEDQTGTVQATSAPAAQLSRTVPDLVASPVKRSMKAQQSSLSLCQAHAQDCPQGASGDEVAHAGTAVVSNDAQFASRQPSARAKQLSDELAGSPAVDDGAVSARPTSAAKRATKAQGSTASAPPLPARNAQAVRCRDGSVAVLPKGYSRAGAKGPRMRPASSVANAELIQGIDGVSGVYDNQDYGAEQTEYADADELLCGRSPYAEVDEVYSNPVDATHRVDPYWFEEENDDLYANTPPAVLVSSGMQPYVAGTRAAYAAVSPPRAAVAQKEPSLNDFLTSLSLFDQCAKLAGDAGIEEPADFKLFQESELIHSFGFKAGHARKILQALG